MAIFLTCQFVSVIFMMSVTLLDAFRLLPLVFFTPLHPLVSSRIYK